MNRRNRSSALLGAAVLAVLAGGCAKQNGGGASADPAAARNAIKADEKQWNDDFKTKNLEALLGHYSDDAYFVAPGGAVSGSTEIRKFYADGLSDKNFNISFGSDKIDVAGSGDLAYARGHFSEKYTDPKTGQIVSDSGSYITVYKKQSDGSWKAVEDFAAADPATRKTTPPAVAKPARMISF